MVKTRKIPLLLLVAYNLLAAGMQNNRVQNWNKKYGINYNNLV
jgi:hypothetical protein